MSVKFPNSTGPARKLKPKSLMMRGDLRPAVDRL